MICYSHFNLWQGDFLKENPLYSLVVDSTGIIQWIGPHKELPKKLKITKKISLKGKNVFPSFIECHTHSVFAGDRAAEFEQRLQGVSYLDIAKSGGGILSTVENTRKISAVELQKKSQERINQFLAQGVSTIEIKSGYALDLKNELKMLSVAQKLKGPRIITTFLGAHALPKEFSSYEKYLDYLACEVLPVVQKKKLSQRVDIFIERNFFDAESGKKFLKKAQDLGFHIVIHANQLSLSGGAELALDLGSQSADHVIHLSDDTIRRWKNHKTVAVLLPLADLYMKCDYPPARKLIDHGVSVALATDFNPGSSPSQDLMLTGLLARLKMHMSLPEVFQAYTLNAAKALGIDAEEGSLAVGKCANFICTDQPLTAFFYSAGFVPKHDLFIRGKKVSRSKI